MIIDLQKFIDQERPIWDELEQRLGKMEAEVKFNFPLQDLERFHYLYERTAADLARLATFSSEPDLRQYLESLVARAYGEIHESRNRQHRLRPLTWLMRTLPATFRRHARAFWLSCAVTFAGMVFGGVAVTFDEESKWAIVPEQFAHLMGDPAERVRQEESQESQVDGGAMSNFSAQLMVNNISVSIKAMAFGMTYGIATLILLFYNGIILGLVAADYVMAGQTVFLLGWLLPHGSVEIPAILIGGQTGLMLAHALIGWGQRNTLRARFRAIVPDLITLMGGVCLLLIWAGIVEAFFSQYHEPVLPYAVKICFGLLQLGLLGLFLGRCGRKAAEDEGGTPA